MLKRYWSIIAAVVVAAIGTPVIWFQLKPGQPNLPRFQYEDARPGQYKAESGHCSPKALAALHGPRKRLSEADACAEEAENHRLTTNDLIQQTRAADAAQAQAELAYQAAWMGLFQTIGGFLTLIAAVAAAAYAREAARHTETGAGEAKRAADEAKNGVHQAVRSAEISKAALAEQRKTSKAELRAWLSIEISGAPIEFKRIPMMGGLGFSGTFIATVQNHGGSVATNAFVDMEIILQAEGVDVKSQLAAFSNRWDCDRHASGDFIFPNQVVKMPHGGSIFQSAINEAIAGQENGLIFPYLLVCATYQTEHVKGRRRTAFAHSLSAIRDGNTYVISSLIDKWWEGEIRVTQSRFAEVT